MKKTDGNQFIKGLYKKYGTHFIPKRIMLIEFERKGLSGQEAEKAIKDARFDGVISFCYSFFGESTTSEKGYELMTEEVEKGREATWRWLEKEWIPKQITRERVIEELGKKKVLKGA